MSKEIISEGTNFEIVQVLRGYRGARTTLFKIDGTTGEITFNDGVPVTGDSAVAGTLQVTSSTAKLLLTAVVAPSTPASGAGAVYVDSTSKNLSVKDDAGVIKHGVQTKTAVTNKVLTAISDAGVVTQAPLPSGAFLVTVTAGVAAPGPVTVTGAAVGDKVIGVANLTTPGDLKSSFETTVTVTNQVQQSTATDLSAQQVQFMILKQS